MKNKKFLRYVNLVIFSLLFILPLASAMEQSFQTTDNITTQVNISSTNQSFTIATEGGTFNYNLTNSTNSTILNFNRNVTCTYNLTDINTNVSGLYYVLSNISSSAAIIARDSADRSAYFLQYTGCLANLTSCSTNLSITAGRQDFQQQYENCISEKTTLQGQVNSLSTTLGNDPQVNVLGSGSGCKKDLNDCQNTHKDDNNWRLGLFVLGVFLGAVGYYQLKVKPLMGHDDINNQPGRQD